MEDSNSEFHKVVVSVTNDSKCETIKLVGNRMSDPLVKEMDLLSDKCRANMECADAIFNKTCS